MLIFLMKARNEMYTIGVDLGGTNIAVGICDDSLKIIDKASVPTGADREGELIVKERLVGNCGCEQRRSACAGQIELRSAQPAGRSDGGALPGGSGEETA